MVGLYVGELDGHSRVSFGSRIIYTTDYNCKQKTAYEIASCLVGSEMCIRDSSIWGS